MVQSVNHPTLDFGSGHDLTVHEFEPRARLHADSAEPDVGLNLVNSEIMT